MKTEYERMRSEIQRMERVLAERAYGPRPKTKRWVLVMLAALGILLILTVKEYNEEKHWPAASYIVR